MLLFEGCPLADGIPNDTQGLKAGTYTHILHEAQVPLKYSQSTLACTDAAGRRRQQRDGENSHTAHWWRCSPEPHVLGMLSVCLFVILSFWARKWRLPAQCCA